MIPGGYVVKAIWREDRDVHWILLRVFDRVLFVSNHIHSNVSVVKLGNARNVPLSKFSSTGDGGKKTDK